MEHAAAHEQFAHLRVLIGVVTGLSLTRLLNGLARFVQHPANERPDPLQLAWTAFLLLCVLHYWWFEFSLRSVERWSFFAYVFVIGYAALFYFACVVLYPDRLGEFDSLTDYFESRQKWFYGLLVAVIVADVGDSALKGPQRLHDLGPAYFLRQGVMILLALAAIGASGRRMRLAIVGAALGIEIGWIAWRYAWLA